MSAGTTAAGQAYGIEAPRGPRHEAEQPAAGWLVLIDNAATASRVARLFLKNHDPVAQFDAGAPEVAQMIEGLSPQNAAGQACWNEALSGHSDEERAAAEVFELDR